MSSPAIAISAVLSPSRLALLRRVAALVMVLLMALLFCPSPARAASEGVEFSQFNSHRSDEGLELSFSTHFELSRPAEEALMNGVVIYFVADVSVYRHRWYWRDARIGRATRTWRLAWQPLYRQYKVSTGGLNQSFASLPEALASLRGVANWRVAEAKDLDADGSYYLDFNYRLDTSQLPRFMQIDLGTAQGFSLGIERTVPLAADFTVQSIRP